ncbi:hypothetical protein SDC9_139582 [bioreactor metagenome]|uniref:DUF304 domain-containing protein n=1 Tax=bioreactor metagenome TaxID=1076179 RepID=A0A645DSW6_9ZZZZ
MSNQKDHKSRKKVEEYSEVMRKEKPHNGFFDAFLAKPEKVTFEDQEENEQVVLVLRQHLITQVKPFASTILAALGIPFLLNLSGFLGSLPMNFQFAFQIFWICFIITLFIRSFLLWFFNVYIITDERIIDVDFHSMIFRNISSAKIENIEDISSAAAGPLAAVLTLELSLCRRREKEPNSNLTLCPSLQKSANFSTNLFLKKKEKKSREGSTKENYD